MLEGERRMLSKSLVQQSKPYSLTSSLSPANRSILVEEDRVKAETESAKEPVDSIMLQLQNLVYEKNHYAKAINSYKDFKSKYPDVELVPKEGFFRNAPDKIKGASVAEDTAHSLMLKRLNYELFQCKELCKLRERLEQAFAENIDLQIIGSMKDAQTFVQQQATRDIGKC